MIHFSKERFPTLPEKATYEYQEIHFESHPLRNRYVNCLKIVVKVGYYYRYTLFNILLPEDNSFPVLVDDGTDHFKECATSENLQAKIDEIMSSEDVITAISNIERAIKNNRIQC